MQDSGMEPKGKSHAQLRVQERTGRDLEELLRELYLERRHSQEEIARACDVNRMTIAAWLTEFGISREDRPAVAL